MWTRYPHAGGIVVGLVLGVGAMWAWEEAPPPAPPPLQAGPSAQLRVPLAQLDELERESTELAYEVEDLKAQLITARTARARGEDPLLAENERLRAELVAVRRDLAQREQMRRELEGEPIAFPENLPAKYREDALMDAFQQAVEASGIQGDIQAIDCSEFPCIVHGEIFAPMDDAAEMRHIFESFTAALKKHYPPGEVGFMNRWNSMKTQGEGTGERNHMFSITPLPGAYMEGIDRRAMGERIRQRSRSYLDSVSGIHR